MIIKNKELFIRYLEETDAEAMLHLERNNREFFQKYTLKRTEDFYTLESQLNRIKENLEKKERDQNYSFGIFQTETQKLIGTIGLFKVERGPSQSCLIGYCLDKGFNGKGYMTEMVRLVVAFAFDELDFHRVEASVMPHNTGSIRVLEKAGFHQEGIARKSIKINGEWEDHQVLAIINDRG